LGEGHTEKKEEMMRGSLHLNTVAIFLLVAFCYFQPAMSQEGTVEKFEMEPVELWQKRMAKSPFVAAAISPDDALCAFYFAEENEIRVVELASGKVVWTANVDGENLVHAELKFTLDSKKLLFVEPISKTLRILDAGTGDELHSIVHETALRAPRFRRDKLSQQETKEVFCFSGDRTCVIVSIDLETGEIKPFFDLLDALPETEPKKKYSSSFYSFRDFMLDSERLYIGLNGTALAFDIDDAKMIWKSKLSNTKPVSFSYNPEYPERVFTYCREAPHIAELDLASGKTVGSTSSVLHFIVGQQEDVLILKNHFGMKRAATLRLVKLGSNVVQEHQISKVSLFHSFSCSPSGKFFVMANSSGQVSCSQIIVGPNNRIDKPETSSTQGKLETNPVVD
jgi:hypothetical protein